MDPAWTDKLDELYIDERASRERVWKALVELDEKTRRKPRENPPEGIRSPLSILAIRQKKFGNYNENFELCYSPDKHRSWVCRLCENFMREHSWSSFNIKKDGVILHRFLPENCMLHKLLDRIAQDFFPGLRISLDMGRSHFSTSLRLVFNEYDEFSTRISTTFIEQRKCQPENEGVRAMSTGQQLAALHQWIEVCNNGKSTSDAKNHNHCHKEKCPEIAAKRLLDLVDAKIGIVRVVEARNLRAPYIALSHCWGHPKRHPIMTTRASLKSHMSGITLSALPRSFRDAITVCLGLGIQYIWIDCLCIVQDDNAEWISEAEIMAEIYAEAYLTIAASRAQNSQHGFLYDFPGDTVHYEIKTEVSWERGMDTHRLLHFTFQINHESSKDDSTPLNKRAWCLQEWYLPRRLVEFCLNDIRFICIDSVETRFGRTVDEHTKTRTIVRAFGFESESFFRQLWESIRDDLWRRSITKTSDMLPAIAGLMEMLEKRLLKVPNHRYLAGLWSTRISEDLSWTVIDYDPETESIGGIPSWSWASTTSTGGYIYGRPSKTYADLVESNCAGYAHPKIYPAYLKINGFVTSLCLRVAKWKNNYDKRPSMTFWIDENSARTTSTEQVEANKKENRTSSFFVSDMPMCPTAHEHNVDDESDLRQVASIMRAPKSHSTCMICEERGYVTTVYLLLLTRTDVSLTSLVLAPILSNEAGDGFQDMYQRIGLLETDCIKKSPCIDTADGYKIPADIFWQMNDPSQRRIISIF